MKDPDDASTLDLLAADTAAAEASRRGPGRPRVHASAAERQRAYRQRLRERGLRDAHRIIRDVREGVPLQSDIIDLSAVPEWRR